MENHQKDDPYQDIFLNDITSPYFNNISPKNPLEDSNLNESSQDNLESGIGNYKNIIDDTMKNDGIQLDDNTFIRSPTNFLNGGFTDDFQNLPFSLNIDTNGNTKQSIPSISSFINEAPPPIRRDSIFFHNSNVSTYTPYVGLLNQGSTCYMNSLLQALFHLPVFRRLVFEINDQNITQNKPDSANIPLNLKLLFARMQLQYDHKAVSTEHLTTSFGWKQPQTFMQHDVQEFSRVLLDNLEEKMKGTPLENSIKYIFGGNYRTYIYTISKDGKKGNFHDNQFYDISLDVSSNDINSLTQNENDILSPNILIDDIYSAFDKYIEEEKLSGDNQYQFEESTKNDAFMKIKFLKLPRVLYLHLKRFQINTKTNQSVKINSFFRFYKSINLTKYIADEILIDDLDDDNKYNSQIIEKIESGEYESEKYRYDLFGVLVHSGTSMSGHYIVYLRPTTAEKWYQFNDSKVSEVSEENAIEENFGGINKTSSAYMLIYVKHEDEESLFHKVENEAIPKDIIDRINVENTSLSKNNNDDKVTFYLFNEETTVKKNTLCGKLSFECDRKYATELPIFKTNKLSVLYKNVANAFQTNEKQVEIWQFLNEGLIDMFVNSNLSDFSNYPNSMDVFVFIKEKDSDLESKNQENTIDNFFNELNKYSMGDLLTGNFSESLTLPIFVFIYCQSSKNPIYYLLSYEVDQNQAIFPFLARAIQKKMKCSEKVNIQYVIEIMNVYVKKLNNTLILIQKNEKETFKSIVKKEEMIKSAFLIISLDEWSQIEVPAIEDDSYALSIYLSQKKQETMENDLLTYNYMDYNQISNQREMNVEQYFNYITDLNLVKVYSFGRKIRVNFPNLISFNDFKNFLKVIFEKEIKKMIHDSIISNINDDSSTNYDEMMKTTDCLIFKKSDVKPIIDCKDNDPMLTILNPNDKKLKVKFIDPSLTLIDDQLTSFLLLDIFISFDSVVVDNRVEEYFNNESTVIDLIKFCYEKFFSNKCEVNSIRVLQLKKDEKGIKIQRIIDPNEKVSSLSNPIRVEKATNISGSSISVSFYKKLTNDPFLIDCSNDLKIGDVKEIIVKNVKLQNEFKQNHDEKENDEFVFSFYSDDQNKIHNLGNDTLIKNITPNLAWIYVESKKNSIKLVDTAVHLYN